MKQGTFSGIKFFILIVFLYVGVGCTKKQSTASLSFQFQSKSLQSLNNDINVLIVNIHHPDGTYQYKKCEQNCSNIEIETTTGPNKLIQVLAVVENNISADLNYGDLLIDLNPGQNSVEINLEKKGSFEGEGKIFGRYIPKAGFPMAGRFLTGRADMKIFVGQGKPAIKIQETEIFAGFINLFALDTVAFQYFFTGFDEVGNKYFDVPLFTDLHDGRGLNLLSPGIAPQGREIVHFSMGSPYFDRNRDGTFVQRPPQKVIAGFFGQNPNTRRYCALPFAATEVLDGSNGKGRVCKNATTVECTEYFKWGDFAKSHTALSGQSETCSGLTAPQKIKLPQITRGGSDSSSIGYNGPFVPAPQSGLTELLDYDPLNNQIKWKIVGNTYLPQGVEVFILNNANSFNDDLIRDPVSEGYLCEKMKDAGFVSLGTYPSRAGQVSTVSTSGYQPSVVAICLKNSSGSYYKTALTNLREENHSGPPESINIVKVPTVDGFSGVTYEGTCYPMNIELRDEDNQLAQSEDGDVTVNLSSNGIFQVFFDNQEDCINEIDAITSVDLNRQHTVWLKSTNTEATFQLTAADNDAALSSGHFSLSSISQETFDKIKLVPSFERNDALEMANTEKCVKFYIASVTSRGELINIPSSSSVSFSSLVDADSNSVSVFESLSDCRSNTNILSSFNLLDDRAMVPVFIQGFPNLKNISNFLSGSNISAQNDSITVVTPGPVSHYHVDVHGDQIAGSCREISVGAFDNHRPNSYPTTFPAGTSLVSIVDNSDDKGLLFNDNLNYGNGSGFPCDNDATLSTVADNVADLGFQSDLSAETVKKFYYQPTTYLSSTNLEFSFAGHQDHQSVSVLNNQPVSGFLAFDDSPIYEFPTQSASTELVNTFTLYNRGSDSLTFSSHSVGPAFLVTGHTCATLSSGNSCTMNVKFVDSGVGTFEDILTVIYTANGDTRRANIKLSGQRVP